MFEKRPFWAVIVGLNVCVLIWLISVQEPVMLDATTAAISSNNYLTNGGAAAATGANSAGIGRDLLSKHLNVQSNEYNDEQAVAASTLTTLTTNHNNNNNSNINTTYIFRKREVPPTSTNIIDLSRDISLTSSLGTGVLNVQSKPTPSWAKLTAVSSALPAEDFNQLIDLHNFEYLMPQPVCSNHIEALILIHSAPKNYEKRAIIRETWGSISHHIADSPLRVLFLLGAVESEQLQNHLLAENNLSKDIIQGSFIDDYRNMTYKHIMAFKWFLYNCPQAQVLVKVDDDVYVNTPQLIKYLKQEQQQQYQNNNNNNDNNNNNPTITTTRTTTETPNKFTTTTKTTISTKYSILQTLNIFARTSSQTPAAGAAPSLSPSSLSSTQTTTTPFNASQELFQHPQNLLFCQKVIGSLVKRSYRSKWRVSFKEYSERYYPPYCPGYAIIYSPDVIFRLYKAAQHTKYFWIDDVHITGVLAQQTNTTITTSSQYVLYSDECDAVLGGKTDLNDMEFLFAWHSISAKKIRALWHLQMMSLKTVDDLKVRKEVVNSLEHHQHQMNDERLKYDIYSSSYSSSSYDSR